MNTAALPGFKDIYPDESHTYEELVSSVNSETIITLCAALNSELTSPEPVMELHKRINSIATHRFTAEQYKFLKESLQEYAIKSGVQFKGLIFFRRYLLAMIIKELNNERTVDQPIIGPEAEYIFFKAYLKIIDEVHHDDEKIIDLAKNGDSDGMWRLKMSWLPIIGQFEMNERGNIILEMLKTGCLLEYAQEHFTKPLAEYLSSFGFSRPSELMGSFQSIYKATTTYDPDAPLRKYTLLSVDKDTNIKHLEAQVVRQNNRNKISFAELKKAPIYYYKKRGSYVILDNYLAQRKVFRGPFFEIFHQTSLKPSDRKLVDDAFVSYSQKIADVLEKRCLKPILSLLDKTGSSKMHFDDGSKNSPDGYIRVDRTIFLFEYKAYFFPEKLAKKPDFDELKSYFDQRFIVNEKGKEKGIHQLRKQISIIYEGGFGFDPQVKELLATGDLLIFPIIVFNDYYFGINGLNSYLSETLTSILPREYEKKLSIAPMVMMNLETILDMVLSNQDIHEMESFIVSYLDYIIEADMARKGPRAVEMFYASTSGFDDVYARYGRQDVTIEDSQKLLEELLKLAGLEFIDYSDDE